MIQITHESHEAPRHIAQTLERAGGVNRFGEPNFRAVWGWNRLGWIGGRWTDLDATGAVAREVIELRYTQKYSAHNRWHIERWCAPEMYGSPESWAKQTLEIEDGRNISALGPFPSRGEYEHVFTLEKVSRADPVTRRFRAAHANDCGLPGTLNRVQPRETAATEQRIALSPRRSEGSRIRFLGRCGSERVGRLAGGFARPPKKGATQLRVARKSCCTAKMDSAAGSHKKLMRRSRPCQLESK